MNAGELAHIGDTSDACGTHAMPWAKLLASRTVWMLWAQYFFMSYAWYFYITWFPTYLKEQFPALTEMQRALLSCVPLFFGGLSCFVSGSVTAPLERLLGGRARTRRVLGVVGMGTAGVMLLISTQLSQPFLSVLAVGLASFCSDLPCRARGARAWTWADATPAHSPAA